MSHDRNLSPGPSDAPAAIPRAGSRRRGLLGLALGASATAAAALAAGPAAATAAGDVIDGGAP